MRPRQGAAAAILDDRGRLLLVKENYDRRRYSLPGGAVEAGETPLETVIREAREETGVAVRVEHVVGVYRLENGFTATLFGCSIASGEPACPDSGEIAEVGWFLPEEIPEPTSNLLHHALEDIVAADQLSDRSRAYLRMGVPFGERTHHSWAKRCPLMSPGFRSPGE